MKKSEIIGLLGGSFNPPHAGHVHVSEEALARLGLDAVWWLISPQNPLKSTAETAPLEERLAAAEALITHPQIRATTLEAEFGTQYTVDTLRALKDAYPEARFVWLMGADNWAQFHQWKDYAVIAAQVPIAVFDRPEYSSTALASPAAEEFAQARVAEEALTGAKTPAWSFIEIAHHPASSTALRTEK